MPPTDPTSSVTADQLTRALGEAVVRIWSNLPQDVQNRGSEVGVRRLQVCPKISRPLCGLLVNFSVLMPRAFRSMRFELEWFEGKPSPPLSHGPRRSAGSESALNWTRCGPGSRSPCKVEGRSAAESAGTNKSDCA